MTSSNLCFIILYFIYLFIHLLYSTVVVNLDIDTLFTEISRR